MALFSAPNCQIGGVHQTDWSFFLLLSFTLLVESLLGIFSELIELNDLRESLGCGVKPLDD